MKTSERFFSKTKLSDQCFGGTRCVEWTAYTNSCGYGVFRVDSSKTVLAHRFAYENHLGIIPHGLELDHLCRNRRCVNVLHVEAVSHRTNVLRGENPAAHNFRKINCKNGHAFSRENTYQGSDGNRNCRTCDRLRVRG